MNWQNHIHTDPEILVGKPVIKGTRLSVEFIIGRLANGWSEQEILENYPTLSKDGLQAVFAYTLYLLKDTSFHMPPNGQAA
ncbi:DUF433 domain-containing protein [Neolewinella antarctica]|uniref:Uncharacterized protein (DUF433 family) n=1 Tax=Neolewinella antarctica TaxID=442734 RepID=A0ABX0XGA0_9BACT|nr:DUF433 domain-containing protein [Neolewinella antarctica]NJC27813.1 uncharacterized protein (DUF433 family) [Neolewinella antarctica]